MIRRLVLALALSSATLASSLAAPAGAAGPVRGTCHELTVNQLNASSDDKPAVSCRGRHDTETLAVVTSPTPLAGLSDTDLATALDHACDASYLKAFGSLRRMLVTAYQEFVFGPTPAQIAAGQHWVRCDIVLWAHTAPLQLPPGHVTDLRHPSYAATACWYTDHGHLWDTSCRAPHSFRTIGIFRMPQDAEPSGAVISRASRRGCPRGTDWLRWSTPWNHYVRCLDRTHH